MRQIARVLVFSLALGYVATLPSAARPSLQEPSDPGSPQLEPRQRDPDDPVAKMEREQLKRLNKERQAALKKDTDRLLELATELKTYVDKSNEHTLSVDVIRKAEEIEKLAKQVRTKMRDTVETPGIR